MQNISVCHGEIGSTNCLFSFLHVGRDSESWIYSNSIHFAASRQRVQSVLVYCQKVNLYRIDVIAPRNGSIRRRSGTIRDRLDMSKQLVEASVSSLLIGKPNHLHHFPEGVGIPSYR